jgi:hypothetical protein
MLKAKINRAYPKLKGIGNSQATMDFIIEYAQEARAFKQAHRGDAKACGYNKGYKWVVYKILS